MAYVDVPLANEKLAVSQPKIRGNFLTANTVMDINHFPFNNTTPDQGKHRYVTLPIRNTIPSNLVNEGVLYTKTSTVSAQTQTQLYYHQDLTSNTNEYQLTRCDEVNAGTFAQNTNYPVPSGISPFLPTGLAIANQNGGWTFLPGGLLLQYGNMIPTGNNTVIKFPIRFSNLFSLTATRNQLSSSGTTWGVTSVSETGFTFSSSSSSSGTGGIFWMAIGN